MKYTFTHKTITFLMLFAVLSSALVAQSKITVVPNAMAQEFVKLFPEIAQGYIDFSGNGKADQTSDLNEYIPESRVRDFQLQTQEILDFILTNWRFISLDKLKAVRTAVKTSPGAISELIAIDYSSALDDAIKQREAMGDGLYLTPSAYKEAMNKIGLIISSMASAYKKEGAKSDADFSSARDSLFELIDKGYPLPEDLPLEEKSVLSTSMTSVILKEQTSNPARTKSAIRILGLLKSIDAAPYLIDLAGGKSYPLEAIKALGEIGSKSAIPVIANQLKNSTSPEIKKAALQATGLIGGAEGLDTILDLVKSPNRDSLSPEILEASTLALAGIAQKGNTDIRVQNALKELTGLENASIRKLAVLGLGSFNTPLSAETLLAIVNSESNVAVRIQGVLSLNKQKNDGVMPALLKLLKEKDLDSELKAVALNALGDNAQGSLGISVLVDALADKNTNVLDAAKASLKKLFPANQVLVTGALTRAITLSQNEDFLVEATYLLSVLADPAAIPTLQALLARPFPEVKRIALWALYKIKATPNPKVVEEIQKLVTNENESIAVRTNAVRALGSIGFDSATLNIAQTLITTTQMRGEKYSMLRLYAVRSLGLLQPMKSQTALALIRTASKDTDMELRKEAVSALKNALSLNEASEEALAASFLEATESELKVRIIETLADIGSVRASSLAGEFLSGSVSLALKKRVISALAQAPNEVTALIILDSAKETEAGDFITSVLEGYPSKLMSSIILRRKQTESDKNILSVIASLESIFSE